MQKFTTHSRHVLRQPTSHPYKHHHSSARNCTLVFSAKQPVHNPQAHTDIYMCRRPTTSKSKADACIHCCTVHVHVHVLYLQCTGTSTCMYIVCTLSKESNSGFQTDGLWFPKTFSVGHTSQALIHYCTTCCSFDWKNSSMKPLTPYISHVHMHIIITSWVHSVDRLYNVHVSLVSQSQQY